MTAPARLAVAAANARTASNASNLDLLDNYHSNSINLEDNENNDTAGQRRITARSNTVEEECLRRELRFFFMNPIEKWVARRKFPWKLFMQVLKIVLATVQLVLFGQMRMGHVQFIEDSRLVLRHLLLLGWDDTRDVNAYPPSVGQMSVYTTAGLDLKMDGVVKQYFTINTSALGTYDFIYPSPTDIEFPPPFTFVMSEYAKGEVFPFNNTYQFDTNLITKECRIPYPTDGNFTFYLKRYLDQECNITMNFDQINSFEMRMLLKTIHLKNFKPYDEPDCFELSVVIIFDNSEHTGRVRLSLDMQLKMAYLCHGVVSFSSRDKTVKVVLGILDASVLIVCFLSFVLCVRALLRAYVLRLRTDNFFQRELQVQLTYDDKMLFLNLWYVIIVVSDVVIFVGTVFKLSIEYTVFDSNVFTATGILLGLGTLFIWCGLIRYLGFFPQYNVIILTLKRAGPNILRFMLCAALLYFGFLFCGWVVLAPYNMKFKTIWSSSECLFALINGDDMFATFYVTSDSNMAVKWFSRIYLYCFIAMFIYVVLSLFISIIMDAYEVIKEHYDPNSIQKSALSMFIALCIDSPSSGKYMHTEEPFMVSFSSNPFVDWVKRCFTRCCTRSRPSDAYNEIE